MPLKTKEKKKGKHKNNKVNYDENMTVVVPVEEDTKVLKKYLSLKGDKSSPKMSEQVAKADKHPHKVSKKQAKGDKHSHKVSEKQAKGDKHSHKVSEEHAEGDEHSHKVSEEHAEGDKHSHKVSEEHAEGDEHSHEISEKAKGDKNTPQILEKHAKVEKKSLKKKFLKKNPKVKDAEIIAAKRARNFEKFKGRGIVMIAQLPMYFQERELREYFSQFGVLTRVMRQRSKKTGNLASYGFVEFLEEDVARVVSEHVNGYILDGAKLYAEFMPVTPENYNLFRNNMELKDKIVNERAERMANYNKRMSESEIDYEQYLNRLQNSLSLIKEKYDIDWTIDFSVC